MELEYIGPERAEEVSEIAYPLFAEVYDYVPRDMLDEFLEETQTPERIREQIADGLRYAFILEDGVRVGYVCYGMDVIDAVEAEARAQSAARIHLDVNYRNEGAIRLYRRKGFVEGERIGYMRVVMSKPLTPSGDDPGL